MEKLPEEITAEQAQKMIRDLIIEETRIIGGDLHFAGDVAWAILIALKKRKVGDLPFPIENYPHL